MADALFKGYYFEAGKTNNEGEYYIVDSGIGGDPLILKIFINEEINELEKIIKILRAELNKGE